MISFTIFSTFFLGKSFEKGPLSNSNYIGTDYNPRTFIT